MTVPIVVSTWTSGAGNFSHTFSISNYVSDYTVHIVATHGVYGTIDRTYAVTFTRNLVDVDGINDQLWLWFAIGAMFFTAAIWPKTIAELGFIIVCGEGWIFYAMGLFSELDNIPNVGLTKFIIGLTVATILAFIAYFKKANQEAGFT